MSTQTIAETSLAGVRGRVLGRQDPDYDTVRRVHNCARASRPEVVVQCLDAADVVAALRAAREAGLPVAVRGGGHSAAGHSSVDDGLVVDLRPLRYVQVDPVARLARVGGGATAGDLDHATAAFGLATPTATVSTVGVAGFTLAGGIGYLTRRHGLALDNLVGADVVLADGTPLRAGTSAGEDPDLLWALRGGGGNVGVVTELRLRLHEVGPVHGGPMFFDLDDTDRVVSRFRDWIGDQDVDTYAFLALLTVPSDGPFPEQVRGRPVCALVWCNTAPVERSRRAIDDFRAGLHPLLDGVAELPLPVLQSAFDAGAAAGTHHHLRGLLFQDLPDEAVPRFGEYGARMPTGFCQSHLYPLDGAAGGPDADETAWAWRDASFAQMVVGAADGPGQEPAAATWASGFRDALAPYAMPGCYANFMMDDVPDPARTAYGPNLPRLAELKRRYDPDNVFRRNVNVSPDDATG
jgi:FAD/FMN-containing dehydrogenase